MYTTKLKEKITNTNIIPNSAILLAIKNEENNISTNFPSLLNQKPKGFDFIVVDDYSTDKSVENLKYLDHIENITILKNKLKPGKKQALSYAISNTKKEYLLLTDADCYVKSEYWNNKMLESFETNTQIVLGYGPYTGKTFLNKFIRFETFMAAVQYFSYYLIRIPYMGVGRNMAIRRSFFIKQDGYNNHFDIKSGNDDLFVNENSNYKNTKIQLDPDTFVYSTPPPTIFKFIKQKTRHVSTSFRYKTIHKLLLGLYSISHIGFYLSLLISFLYLPFYYSFTIWLFRILIIYISSYKSFIKLKENDLLKYLPILDFLMFIYYTFIAIYYFFAPKNKW